MTDNSFITVKEAAEILKITTDGVRKAIRREVIEAYKFGERMYAVSKDSVVKYRDVRRPGSGRPRSK